MLNAIILAALSVVPVYTNHNRVAGNVQTMTNIQSWAQAVETAIENSGTDTNAVSSIITNHVTSGYLCTSNAAVTIAGSAGVTNLGAVAKATADADAKFVPFQYRYEVGSGMKTTLNDAVYEFTPSDSMRFMNQYTYWGESLSWYFYVTSDFNIYGSGTFRINDKELMYEGDAYTKGTVDTLLSQKASTADVYTKTEADAEFFHKDGGVIAGNVEVEGHIQIDGNSSTVMIESAYDKKFNFVDMTTGEISSDLTPDNSVVLTKNLGDSYYLGINGQIQSDWDQTNTGAKDYIKNKPTIPAAITEYLKSATSTATSITVTKHDDTTVGLEVQYGYELGAFTSTISSGEIRSITPASSTAIPVTLNFGSDATKAADAMLYVDATALAADVDLSLSGYTFIGDTGYQTATHGKKVIFYFTRINANTVIANKREY